MKHIAPPRLAQVLLYGGAVVVLLAVFALYTQPDFLVELSNQLWACF